MAKRGASLSDRFRGALTSISPLLNNRVVFWVKFRKRLNLKNPKTFNEKILWLKFNKYLEDESVKRCADKYLVREYVESKGLGETLIPLKAAFSSPDLIDVNKLPDKYVLKYNTGCGCNFIQDGSKTVSSEGLAQMAREWQSKDYWRGYAEMQYKDVPPMFLVEDYLSSGNGGSLVDYKFYCWNGNPCFVMVCEGRDSTGHGARYFLLDENWSLLPMTEYSAADPGHVIERPLGVDRAFEVARILSSDWPFVRVDLYIIDGHVYFGELTFTPAAGMDTDWKYVIPEKFTGVKGMTTDDYLGTFIDLGLLCE